MADRTAAATPLAGVDRDAFTELVVAHDADLRRFAFLVAGDLALAEDAVQATWERLWASPPSLREPDRLRSWLLTVAANEARQVRRRRRRGSELELQGAPPRGGENPGERAAALDLERVLRRLSPDERELLALRYVAELTSAQLAAHLGLTPEGARSRLHRLVTRLREELDG